MTQKQRDRFKRFIEANEWREAKTYAKTAPHSYALRDKASDDMVGEFPIVAGLIRKYGEKVYFWKTPYMYLYFEGYKYWSMDKELKDTNIINRAVI